jgi:ABC-type multidrug transport system ATPase subunit
MRIITKNLSKRFNREWIFKDLNYQFNSSGIYAIVGPNGSGKSTLLQVLWGQMVPSAGSVYYALNDKEIPQPELFKHISIATPYMDLIDEFTLLEMVKFHFSFKEIRDNNSVEEVIELLGLNHARDKAISNFSSGMRQRLKLGLAFFSKCNALFLDEPTTNLDRKSIDWYGKNLEQIPKDTLIFIASNQDHEYPAKAQKIDILTYKTGLLK